MYAPSPPLSCLPANGRAEPDVPCADIELRDIGDVTGKTLLYLQCHIGTDSLSWVRNSAIVTGVDFSARSVECAKALRDELGMEATFVQSNVYDLPDVLDERFDIVYTLRGVLCWLKDLNRWGELIARYLKPGGLFYLMESHPLLNIFDDAKKGDLSVRYPYFHSCTPMKWTDDGSDYADDEYVPQNPSHEWVWPVSDIINALLGAGLRLESVGEYDRLFFKWSPEMENLGERWYHFPRHAGQLPLLLTVMARKAE